MSIAVDWDVKNQIKHLPGDMKIKMLIRKGPDQTAPKSSLILACTVYLHHFNQVARDKILEHLQYI